MSVIYYQCELSPVLYMGGTGGGRLKQRHTAPNWFCSESKSGTGEEGLFSFP